MSNAIGDNLKSCLKRGGFKNIQIAITRSFPTGSETETLLPCRGGEWKDEMVYKQGLDGKIDVQYYKFTIAIEFLQTDTATLADMFSSALESQFLVTGVSTTITFMDSSTKTLTLRWTMSPHGEGYDSVMSVRMEGVRISATPLFR